MGTVHTGCVTWVGFFLSLSAWVSNQERNRAS